VPDITLFIQAHGHPGILEVKIPDTATVGEFRNVLAASGITLDDETFVFIEDAEHHITGGHDERLDGLKHGCRVHVCRCRHVKVTINFLEKTAERTFPPGARVRSVKEWAVHKFEMDPKDAAEHVLQICKSKERPSSDTRLNQLLHGHHGCALCFDLVPDKRVEG
jgi:hypothetical protein